uniref:Uncharacterized protein n=1 Tax=Chelydra serpentina TaxID=8475 RepID=A0A8C3SLX8_CHESE
APSWGSGDLPLGLPGTGRRASAGLRGDLPGTGSGCSPGAARTVKCVNRNLTAVPPDLPPYTRLLFLTGNRLASLPPGAVAFLSLPQLQSLDLSHNSLKCLKNATIAQLRSLPALRRISLDIQSQLQTSYVFLGIVLALIGAIFLLLYSSITVLFLCILTEKKIILFHKLPADFKSS